MKKLLFPVILIFLVASCSKDLEMEVNEDLQKYSDQNTLKSASVESDQPWVVLKANKQDKIVQVKLHTPFFAGVEEVDLVNLTIRPKQKPEILYQEWDNLIEVYSGGIHNNPLYTGSNNAANNPLFKMTFDELEKTGKLYEVEVIYYLKDGKIIRQYKYDAAFIAGETNAAMFKPLVKPAMGELRYDVSGLESSLLWLPVLNPNSIVNSIEVKFTDPVSGENPLVNPIIMKHNMVENNGITTFDILFDKENPLFKSNPAGSIYKVFVTLKDKDGNAVAETVTKEFRVDSGKLNPEIQKIEAKRLSENQWEVSLVVLEKLAGASGRVILEFNPQSDIPGPVPSILDLKYSNRVKPNTLIFKGMVTFEKGFNPSGIDFSGTAYYTRYRGPKTKIARRFKEPTFNTF